MAIFGSGLLPRRHDVNARSLGSSLQISTWSRRWGIPRRREVRGSTVWTWASSSPDYGLATWHSKTISFVEAHRLYESGTPLSEAINRLLGMAGENPNAFRGFTNKNTRGLNRTAEGRAILRVVGTASLERDDPNPARTVGSGWWPGGD